jgi:predicted RNA-binding Zn-ribbon protein involved in translation (DUF1610 family)
MLTRILAREHVLSTYNPICHACGLILCELNLPQYACPSCASVLYTPATLSTRHARIELQISEQLAKEAEEREQAIENARQAAGAFPTLAGGTPPPLPLSKPQPQQAHKVISLNSKTKKVVVSSYRASPPPPTSTPVSVQEEDIPIREPPPPTEVSYAKARINPSRPWADLRQGARVVRYVPGPKKENVEPVKKSRRNRGKGKAQAESQVARVVPGSGADSGSHPN